MRNGARILLRSALVGGALAILIHTPGARAHEARPAYLEITETAPGRYNVLWRIPVLSGTRLPVVLRFPDEVRDVIEPGVHELPDSLVERRVIAAGGDGLAGKRVEFMGLQATITDVLVRVRLRDGRHTAVLVQASRPWIEVAAPRGPLVAAAGYLTAGIHHILLGVDHLLFVLGLLLLVKDRWMLVKTVSAFTVAHSITLAIATLGYAQVPALPLNAAIALSILFLGAEVVRSWRGRTSLTIRQPWVVAFAFGLLHGFGFASGLTTMGLPRAEIPLALLTFNVGVEVGQLAFVLLVLLLERAFHVLEVRWPPWVEALPAYTVGSLGAYWTIQRVVMLLAGAR
jgi:hydrogenase/urease accessory protein HupE